MQGIRSYAQNLCSTLPLSHSIGGVCTIAGHNLGQTKVHTKGTSTILEATEQYRHVAKSSFPNHQLATEYLALLTMDQLSGGRPATFLPFRLHAYPNTHVLSCELEIALTIAVCGIEASNAHPSEQLLIVGHL